MNHALQAYNVMTTTTPNDMPHSQSTWSILISSTMLHRLNKHSMVHLWTGELMVVLQDLMEGFSQSHPGSVLLLGSRSMVWTLCNVQHWLNPTMDMLTSS